MCLLGVTDRVTDAEKKVLDELIKDPGYSYVNIANNLGISKKTVAERNGPSGGGEIHVFERIQ